MTEARPVNLSSSPTLDNSSFYIHVRILREQSESRHITAVLDIDHDLGRMV